MLKISFIFSTLFFVNSIRSAADELVQIKSNHSVKQTTKNLVKILKKKGMTVFDVIIHQKDAKKVGKKLRPTTVVIFRTQKAGTPLIQCAQTTAIDLPQKALIHKDEGDQVWYPYNELNYLAKRHKILGYEKALVKTS